MPEILDSLSAIWSLPLFVAGVTLLVVSASKLDEGNYKQSSIYFAASLVPLTIFGVII